MMRFEKTEIPGLIVVEPRVLRDRRGFFLEVYHAEKFGEAGIDARFVQDNHSMSTRGTLRGLHGQRHHPQGKLVRVIEGVIWDVAVDVRPGSKTFGRWASVELDADSMRQLWVPPDFLHGFCVMSERAQVEYKCTEVYRPDDEYGARWNDPDLAIPWPVENPIVSDKDAALPSFAELARSIGG